MKRASWLRLSLCVAMLPLFSGCGGCGGAPSSIDAMRRARGSWGSEEEEAVANAEATPAVPTEQVVAAPPDPAPATQPSPTPQPAPQVQPTPVAQPAPPVAAVPVAVQPTPAVAQAPAPAVAIPPAAVAGGAAIPTGVELQRRIASLSKPPKFGQPTISNAPRGYWPVAGEEEETASVPRPTPTAVTTVVSEETEQPVSPPAPSGPAENLLQVQTPAVESTVSLLPQAKALAGAGNETDADRLLLGEAMLRDRVEDWPFQMRWAPALRRPAPWLRAAVAFEVTTVDLRGEERGVLPAKDRALERDFGKVGTDVLDLGGELAEKTLAPYLTLVRSGELGPTLAPRAAGAVDRGRPMPVRMCGGIVVLAPGEERLLKAHAARLGLDLLIVFEVRAKRNPNDPKQPVNDTSVKVIDVVGDREIYSSAVVRNLEVQDVRKNPIALDPIEPVAADIRKFIETQLPLADFPSEVRPDNVRSRIGSLIDQALASKNALPYLVEIKSLQLKGYLSGLEARDAYIAVLGEAEGEALYSGTPEARLEALEALLPRAVKNGAGAAEPAGTPSPTETVKTDG